MIPIILSGGGGSRLWPLSKGGLPKQFCALFESPLFEMTYRRVSQFGSPWVVTTQALKSATVRSLRGLGAPTTRVIYEPCIRNTGPAIAVVTYLLCQAQMKDEIAAVLPSDHLIQNETAFRAAFDVAIKAAAQDKMVTLGIRPTFAATGFGYIELGQEPSQSNGAVAQVLRFVEKPDVEKARHFLASKRFLWNAGIFVFRVGAMATWIEKYLPEVWSLCQQLKDDQSNLAEIYSRMPSISIDYGLMEKLPDTLCVSADIGWSDVGSWDSLVETRELFSQLNNGAEVLNIDADGCVAFSRERKDVVFVGVSDLVAVDTPDGLLVYKKGSSEKVRKAGEQIPLKTPLREIRPWGEFEILADRKDFKAKVITVDPQSQISYQSHEQRSEHWIVVQGKGHVILDEKKILVQGGSSVHIPMKSKHRIMNEGDIPLVFVEVQTGSYFGEDDIVRFSDDFGRV